MPADNAIQDILRCPNCGSTAIIWGDLEHDITVMCQTCKMRGPSAGTDSSAIGKWNNLPRKLKWFSGEVVSDGWYMIKDKDNKITLKWLKQMELLDDVTWAGPIPEPE